MIKLTDLGGRALWLNVDLIEKITVTPNTLISLLNGTNMMVRDNPEEIVAKIIEFRRLCGEKPEPDVNYTNPDQQD
jgi:flagellar protein FlbD